MANHVLYDALWESDRLSECSRDAALAYPWIFLVADDHGRFEYKPRAVWKNAFAYRQDITVEDVARWMNEYWKVGLLIRYHLDGDLAHWYKFKGRRPSERRKSEYPEPEGMPAFTYKAPGARDESEERRDEPATSPRQPRVRDRSDLDQEIEQSRADIAPPTDAARVVEAVVVPEESLVPALSWSNEAVLDWREFLGGEPLDGVFPALKRLVRKHTWAHVRPRWREFLAQFDPKFVSHGVGAKFAATYDSWSQPARASPIARQRAEQAVRTVMGGVKRDERSLGPGDEADGGEPEGSGFDS